MSIYVESTCLKDKLIVSKFYAYTLSDQYIFKPIAFLLITSRVTLRDMLHEDMKKVYGALCT
jgi:uncharacterized membrane protein YhhN